MMEQSSEVGPFEPAKRPRRALRSQILLKLGRWVIWVVVLGLAPLVFKAQIAYAQDKSFSWRDIISNGELILISIPIAGSGVAETVRRMSNHFRLARQVNMATGLLLIISCSATYGNLSLATSGRSRDIVAESIALFLSSVIVGASSIALSAVEK